MKLNTVLPRMVLLLLALIVSACANVIPDIDPPTVTVENFKQLPSDGVGPRFQIVLRVSNPNKQELDIAGVAYTIELLDKELVSGVTNEVPVIAPYAEETVTLEAGVHLFSLLRMLTSLGSAPQDSLPYKFSAKIDFNGFIPTQRVEETGELNFSNLR